jgi:hypothetical protein
MCFTPAQVLGLLRLQHRVHGFFPRRCAITPLPEKIPAFTSFPIRLIQAEEHTKQHTRWQKCIKNRAHIRDVPRTSAGLSSRGRTLPPPFPCLLCSHAPLVSACPSAALPGARGAKLCVSPQPHARPAMKPVMSGLAVVRDAQFHKGRHIHGHEKHQYDGHARRLNRARIRLPRIMYSGNALAGFAVIGAKLPQNAMCPRRNHLGQCLQKLKKKTR